jgi:hypothetical protein
VILNHLGVSLLNDGNGVRIGPSHAYLSIKI